MNENDGKTQLTNVVTLRQTVLFFWRENALNTIGVPSLVYMGTISLYPGNIEGELKTKIYRG